nr:hypothetical protein Iba_chr02eCG11380 [Ipomoea batatas]
MLCTDHPPCLHPRPLSISIPLVITSLPPLTPYHSPTPLHNRYVTPPTHSMSLAPTNSMSFPLPLTPCHSPYPTP